MSRRYLALWLPRFATDRIGRLDKATDPFATLVEEVGVPRITSANAAAAALGIGPGMALADARALFPALATCKANPLGEARDLTRLANWCDRYTPLLALDGPDGLMLDITGCDHLFGGEAAMLRDLVQRLASFGFTAQAAIASTPGAAWALCRYRKNGTISADHGALRGLLGPLPVAALRLPEDVVARLAQVGLRRIGDLLDLPRAPLATRFGAQVMHRLSQALGLTAEAITAHHQPTPYRFRLDWAEPVRQVENLTAAATQLLGQLCERLTEAQRGARHLLVTCHTTDGHTHRVEARTSAPVRQAGRLLRLLEAGLEACDLGFGIETMILSVPQTELLTPSASSFWRNQVAMGEDTAALIDRLSQRLGERRVGWPQPIASHIPERATMLLPALRHRAASAAVVEAAARQRRGSAARPLRLLARPEPIQAMALLPDHPPAAFRWRHILHRTHLSGGPERIAPEWWRDLCPTDPAAALDAETRDYYMVENQTGQRFWLFRQGLYDRAGAQPTAPPAWFLQGILA
jgi:protein ImuB